MPYTLPSGELLNLTKAMLVAAEAGNWEEVGKTEIKRQVVLKRLDAIIDTPEGQISINAIANNMREVLLLNKRIMDLGRRVKAELAEAMGGLSQSRKAVNAYYEIME